MSEQPVFGFAEQPSFAEAARLAERLLREGHTRALAEELLAEVGSGVAWRRARVLERVAAVGPDGALLRHLVDALADGANAERRNAARSLLAALGAPGSAAADAAVAALGEAAASGDADVRVLAASALGESGNPAARPAAERLLHDAESNVASAAADALGVIGDAGALRPLAEVAAGADLWRALSAIVALGRIGGPGAVEPLQRAASDFLRRGAAIPALGETGHPEALEALRSMEPEADTAQREQLHDAAASLLARQPDAPVPGWLRASLAGREPELAARLERGPDEQAARLLGIAGTAEAAHALVAAIARPGREAAVGAGLTLLPAEIASPAILDALPDASAECRTVLLSALPPPDGVDALRRVLPYLSDDDATTRAVAVERLSQMPAADDAVLQALVDALGDERLRLGAVRVLGRLGPERCALLAGLVTHDEADTRLAAAEGLARCATPAVADAIAARLDDEADHRVICALLHALATARGAESVPVLARYAAHAEERVRFAAAGALGQTSAAEALPHLVAALDDASASVRAAAIRALGALGDARAEPALSGQLDAPGRDHRRIAARALAELAPAGALARLRAALRDDDREVRLAAVRALARAADAETAAELDRAAREDPDAWVRQAAAAARAGDAMPPAGGPA